MREVLNGVGGSSNLMVLAGGDFAGDAHQKPRLHGEARNRRIVLDDDGDFNGGGDGSEVAHHGVGIQLGRAGRADHDGVRAGLAREPGVIDAGAHAVGGSAGDYAHAPIHVADHGLEHAHTFAIVHARHFAGDAERGEAVDARADEEIDDALETFQIQVAGRGKGRRQDGVYAFQLQTVSSKEDLWVL